MSDEGNEPRIHVDSGWKAEAQQEKERLAEQEARAAQSETPLDKPTIMAVVNLIATQAVVGLSGMKAPTGETIPPDPNMARVFIDMLAVIEEKTKGNLTAEEADVLGATLHELRMQYVRAVGAVTGGSAAQPQTE